MEETEIWKDIPDFNGFYQVSNFGRVKSIRKYKNGDEIEEIIQFISEIIKNHKNK